MPRDALATPPWKWQDRPKGKASRRTLDTWRKRAQKAAVAKGASRACDLCKRATMFIGSVTVQQAAARKVTRFLCSEHYTMLTTLLADLENTLDNYDLPIDRLAIPRKGPA